MLRNTLFVAAVDREPGRPPGQRRGEVLEDVVADLAAAGVDGVEQREAVVTGGPGVVVADQVVGAAVGHVDAVGEHVPDPRVLDRRCCRCSRPSTGRPCARPRCCRWSCSRRWRSRTPCPARRSGTCSCRSTRSPVNDDPLADASARKPTSVLSCVAGAWNRVYQGPAPTTRTALPYTWNFVGRLVVTRRQVDARSLPGVLPHLVQRVLHVLMREARSAPRTAPGPGWRSARPARC